MNFPSFDGTQLCAQVDPELFFPERGEQATATQAKAICAQCPFKTPCAEYALRFEIRGIWGGTSEQDRRKIGKARGIKRKTLVPLDMINEPSQSALQKRAQRERDRQSQALGVA